jgi:hypothetical protein
MVVVKNAVIDDHLSHLLKESVWRVKSVRLKLATVLVPDLFLHRS